MFRFRRPVLQTEPKDWRSHGGERTWPNYWGLCGELGKGGAWQSTPCAAESLRDWRVTTTSDSRPWLWRRYSRSWQPQANSYFRESRSASFGKLTSEVVKQRSLFTKARKLLPMSNRTMTHISVPRISLDRSCSNLTPLMSPLLAVMHLLLYGEWSKYRVANSHACGVWHTLSPSGSCSHAA